MRFGSILLQNTRVLKFYCLEFPRMRNTLKMKGSMFDMAGLRRRAEHAWSVYVFAYRNDSLATHLAVDATSGNGYHSGTFEKTNTHLKKKKPVCFDLLLCFKGPLSNV